MICRMNEQDSKNAADTSRDPAETEGVAVWNEHQRNGTAVNQLSDLMDDAAKVERQPPPRNSARKDITLEILVPVIHDLRGKNLTWKQIQKWLAERSFHYEFQSLVSAYSKWRKHQHGSDTEH